MRVKALSLITAALLTGNALAAPDNTGINASSGKRIVGGEEATQGDWPWMSALVFTFNEISTSLTVNDQDFTTQAFNFGAGGSATGVLVDCGIGDAACADATDKICLIERGEINFSEKVLNCQAGGGVGAIIYNNAEGNINGTLGEDFAGTIPAVAVTQEDGNTLSGLVGESATMSVAAEEALTQSSNCGGSYLGDGWVLTAAHCVDDSNAQFLKVNVGEYDLSDGAANASEIANIYSHYDYSADTLNNDIALIQLTEVVDAPAISLPTTETVNQYVGDNSAATVMGWGGRQGYEPGEGPTSDFPDVLHQVELQLFSNQECAETMAESQGGGTTVDQVGLTDAMICAGTVSGGKGSCQGDSGGPLVVNTNEGWQQFGVVSWGIGCAAEGWPGVYARVSEFHDWMDAISKGIAVEPQLDFGYIPANATLSATVKVANNSADSAALTFSSDVSEYAFSNCDTVEAGATCDLTVAITPSEGNTEYATTMSIEVTDNTETKTSKTKVSAYSVPSSSTIDAELGGVDSITWFSGGDAGWVVNNTDDGFMSGNVDDDQESIMLAQINASGTLEFEWSVSSEENADDPSEPFDTLYLYVNGQMVDFISGEVDFTTYTLELSEDSNLVAWVYRKDPAVTEGDDEGYVRNITFGGVSTVTPEPAPEPTPEPTPEPESSSSGGGSMGWLSLLLAAGIGFRRRK